MDPCESFGFCKASNGEWLKEKPIDHFATTLIAVHVGTGFPHAVALEGKGSHGVETIIGGNPSIQYAVESVISFINFLALVEVLLQTDNEPAIREIAEKIRDKRTLPTRWQCSPVRSRRPDMIVTEHAKVALDDRRKPVLKPRYRPYKNNRAV